MWYDSFTDKVKDAFYGAKDWVVSFARMISEKIHGVDPEMDKMIKENDIAALDKLLNNKTSSSSVMMNGLSPACYAVSLGRLEILSKLIESGTSVNELTKGGLNKLIETAIYCGRPEVLELLFKNNAQLGSKNCREYYSMMQYLFELSKVQHNACASTSNKIMNVLSKYLDLDTLPVDSFGNTLLQKAILSSDLRAVEWLMQFDIHADVIDKNGNNYAHLVAQYVGQHWGFYYDHILRFLMLKGCDMQAVNSYGLTPLDLIRQRGADYLIKEYEAYKSKVDSMSSGLDNVNQHNDFNATGGSDKIKLDIRSMQDVKVHVKPPIEIVSLKDGVVSTSLDFNTTQTCSEPNILTVSQSDNYNALKAELSSQGPIVTTVENEEIYDDSNNIRCNEVGLPDYWFQQTE